MKKHLIGFVLLFISTLQGELSSLYPPIESNRNGFLDVEGGHSLYWEESGNPNGQPILFLHGGPGMGTSPNYRRYFDPNHYRIILFDQRGCGKSRPFASLNNNTTWDLVDDIDLLRKFLEIENWLVFGGSWGSTLGLTYTIKHTKNVQGLILRGIFLCRPKEISWFYQFGAHKIFPDIWEDYVLPIPFEEREDMIKAFYKRLKSPDTKEKRRAAIAWATWEGKASKLRCDQNSLRSCFTEKTAYALALIESHYFFNNAFFDSENWILENMNGIRHLPCIIIQGRYDMVCPMESAWELHKKWPEARFEVVSDAGHSSSEPGIVDALIRATDWFAEKKL